MKDPFLPIARPFAGRKTSADLFGLPEEPFPLVRRAVRALVEDARHPESTLAPVAKPVPGHTLELSGPIVLGVRIS